MLRDGDGAHAHRDDAALMLSLVSGRFPGPPPVESELFKTWIDTLWDLPASAPEWPADAANLGKWIRYILREKEREIIEGVVHKIADQWNGIENEFNDDLHYLGIGTLTLQTPLGGPEFLIGTLEFLTALRVQLEAYRPLRPQAASRREELERSEARRAAEDGILKLTAEWRERMARARQAREAATAAHGAEPAVEAEEPPTGKQADTDPAAIESLTAERDRLQAELRTLREENGRLRSSNEELNAESGRRDDETRKLNDLIVRSRRTEEQWRQAYVESRKGRRPDDTPVSIDSVGEAVALAREAFPDRLLIKLNSRSNENTPFTNPAEVYDALAWLATAHCDGNDDRIGEACSGWTCKTSQREESIAKYREWYETLADGKTWYLGAHIGKGTSRDPRHTIRIGFARDRGRQPRGRRFHRPAPAKPAVMKNRQEAAGAEWTAGSSPGGWTARVERDCRRRGGPPCGGAARAGCSAAHFARRTDGAGTSPRTRDAFSRGWIEDAVPGSPPGPVAMVWREDDRRDAQRSGGAAPGWRGVGCRRSGRMAGYTTGMGARTGRWPARRRATGPPAACWRHDCGWRLPGRQRSLPTPGRAGPARASRPDASAGPGPARPGR